jgi:cell division protein FtsQ
MPAALRGDRRVPAATRARASAKAARPGFARGRPGGRGASKLSAAKQSGPPAAAAWVAACLLAVLVGVAVLATGGRGEALWRGVRAAGKSDLATLGFRANVIHLQGTSPAAQKEVLAAAALKPGVPILDVDLAGLRQRVERVGWVARARVIRLLPDTLVIAVTQRPLMAVWQHGGRTAMVADNGAVMPQVDPARFSALPLIVGAGANVAAAPLLALVSDRPRLAQRLNAMVRVDDRRWDLRMKDGGVIMLPSEDEAAALKRLDDLDRTAKILDLGFARIDLRDPEMVVVRPRGVAAPALAGGGV